VDRHGFLKLPSSRNASPLEALFGLFRLGVKLTRWGEAMGMNPETGKIDVDSETDLVGDEPKGVAKGCRRL